MSNEQPAGTVPVIPAHTFPAAETLILGRTAPAAAKALEAAGLLAVTEPVMLRTHTNTQGGDLLNTLVGGFTEMLKRLGYAGTVVAEESPFGGWNLALAARRMTPEERGQ